MSVLDDLFKFIVVPKRYEKTYQNVCDDTIYIVVYANGTRELCCIDFVAWDGAFGEHICSDRIRSFNSLSTKFYDLRDVV